MYSVSSTLFKSKSKPVLWREKICTCINHQKKIPLKCLIVMNIELKLGIHGIPAGEALTSICWIHSDHRVDDNVS